MTTVPATNIGIYYGIDTVVWYDEDGIQHVEYLEDEQDSESEKSKRKIRTRSDRCRRQPLRGLRRPRIRGGHS